MAQGRVQAPELRTNIRLQPAPMQSDTYAAPARPVRNDNLFRLADALGSFSNSIGNLVPIVAGQNKKKDEEDLWALQKRLSGMTRDEQVEAVKNGSIMPWQNEFEQKAIMGSHGMAFGAHRVAQIQNHLQTEFNWDAENPDDYITALITEDLEQFGSDKNFGAQYLRQLEGARNWAIEYGEKRRTGQHVQDKRDAAFMVIDTKIDELVTKGAEPYDVAKYISASYSELGADGTLGVDYDALDQEVLNKARRIASVHPEVALELMEITRKGRGGQDISIATRGDMRDAFLQVQATARKAISDRSEKEYLDGLTGSDVRLLEEGNLDYVEDARYTTLLGEEKVVTAQQRREKAKDYFFRLSRSTASVNREEPQETLGRELRALRLSGEKHPAIERQVTGIADMAHVGLSDDADGRAKLLGKLKTYEWLQNESTASLLSYTKEDDRDFAETYLMAKRYLTHDDGRTYSDDEAMNFAIRSTQITREGMPLASALRDEIDTAVGSLSSKPGWLWGILPDSDVEPQNAAIAQQRVTTLAQRFVRLGVKPAKAVEMAGEAVKKTSITYNGVLLDLQGRDIPDNFKEVVDGVIGDFAKAQPHVLELNDLSADRLSIAPRSSGSQSGGEFILIDREDMLPIADENGKQVVVRLSDVRAESNRRRVEAERKALRDAALRSSVKSRGYVEAVDTDGQTYWVDAKTREIVEFSFGEDATAPVWKKTGRRYRRGILTSPEGGIELRGN